MRSEAEELYLDWLVENAGKEDEKATIHATVRLKGTSHYQESIRSLTQSIPITGILYPDPLNPYDPFACQVQSPSGVTIGYLPKGWQQRQYGDRVIKIIKAGEGVVPIQIVGGFILLEGNQAYYGVLVNLDGIQ